MALYRNHQAYQDALQHVLAGIADGSIYDDAEANPAVTDKTDAEAALAALLAAAEKADAADPKYNLPS